MKSKPTSVWKRYQFCGGIEIFGTQCYIDKITEIVHYNCTKENNLKGFDWTIIYYFFKWLNKTRFNWWKDKSNRTQEQAWHDLPTNFNSRMNFVKEEDIKNGTQLKDCFFTACGELYIHILP